MSLCRRAIPALLVCGFLASSLRLVAQDTSLDRGRMQDVLGVVSKEVEKNYADPKMRGLDWKAATEDSRQRIRKANNMGEMVTAIFVLLNRLEDSHTLFIPPGRTERAIYGFKAMPFGDKILVYDVDPKGPAAKAGLKVGDEIFGVNGFRANRQNFMTMMVFYRALSPNMSMQLVIGREGQEPFALDIPTKIEPHFNIVQFDSITWNEMVRESEKDQPVFTYQKYDGGIEYLGIPSFELEPGEIASLLKRASDSSAVIIDLRKNPGGILDTLMRSLQSFASGDETVAQEISRDKTEDLKIKPHDPQIRAPLFILVDSESASAAEIFARYLQYKKRAVIIGDQTSGSVNVARFFPEHIGAGTAIFFGVEITVARLKMPDGQELEGKGVTPDEVCIPTAKDLTEKHDVCLDRALALVRAALPKNANPAGSH